MSSADHFLWLLQHIQSRKYSAGGARDGGQGGGKRCRGGGSAVARGGAQPLPRAGPARCRGSAEGGRADELRRGCRRLGIHERVDATDARGRTPGAREAVGLARWWWWLTRVG